MIGLEQRFRTVIASAGQEPSHALQAGLRGTEEGAFRHACEAANRSLLRKQGLATPADIFVRPDCFELEEADLPGQVRLQVTQMQASLFSGE